MMESWIIPQGDQKQGKAVFSHRSIQHRIGGPPGKQVK